MMNVQIVCTGKIKETSIRDICFEYEKRLSKYCKINIIELTDESLTNVRSEKDEEKIKTAESKKALAVIEKISNPYLIALDPNGKMYDSVEFSKKLENISNLNSNLVFIIGGSLGISSSLLEKCDEKISFSKMTFPHQLFRAILLEQIYRGFKITKKETYHK